MITRIKAKGFKGLTFDEPLDRYNLLVGPNGIGKSARSEALSIAILGYNPRDAQKRTGDIYHTHSAGEPWTVGINIDEDTLSRTFLNGANATQVVAHNGKKLKAKQVEATLVRLGEPTIFDLTAFMALSDNKKIEYLFDLFPPDQDISEIEKEIDSLDRKEKSLAQKAKGLKAAIEQLTAEKTQLQIPGSLPDISKEIEEKEAAMKEAEKELNEIEAKEREGTARQKAEQEAKEREEKAAIKADADKKKAVKEAKTETERRMTNIRPEPPAENEPAPIQHQEKDRSSSEGHPDSSDMMLGELLNLKSIMESAGCEFCAAMIVLTSIIRRYKRGGAQ